MTATVAKVSPAEPAITGPEIRRLLVGLLWPAPGDPARVLAWSYWRRRHQARARRCHYQRREQRLRRRQ